ncbi:MAG: energy transducer TonB, partial [Proteobacteria bacterium]|nr:energy transducer TonB [Pseudomonadota bacterium]
LAQQLVEKLPQDITTDIVKEKPPEQPKTPPPPPPDMVKPPPAVIPPPDIQIAAETNVNTITAVTTNTAPPPPKPAAVAATLARGRGNDCASSYYPPLAVRLNHEGSTTLTVHIGADGQVTGTDISNSSGYPELDEAAQRCVQNRWHFAPATQNGAPIASTKEYRIVWKLR